MSSSVITFSRKNRNRGGADSALGGSDVSSGGTASTYVTAPSVLTPVPESPAVEQDENAAAQSTAKTGGPVAGCNAAAGLPANRWRRKNAAERQEAERRQYLAEMRAYFEEVDNFELAVETPPASTARAEGKQAEGKRSPRGGRQQGVARALAAAAPTPGTAMRQRPMSLGLSRRRSSMVVAWPMHTALASSTKANHSPLKLAVPPSAADGQEGQQPPEGPLVAGRRSALLPAGPHRLSVAADNAGMVASPGWAVNRHSLATRGRRSSVAPTSLSGTGKMLSRLSVGLTDALQWLGIKGKIPAASTAAAAAAAGEGQHRAAAGGAAMPADRPALSPIASPGGEDGGSTAGEDSVLPASMAITALEQLPAGAESMGASVTSPAVVAHSPAAAIGSTVAAVPSPVLEGDEEGEQDEEAAAPAVQQAAAGHGRQGDGSTSDEEMRMQSPAAANVAAAAEAGLQHAEALMQGAAADEAAAAEPVQQLEQQLAEKLQLQDVAEVEEQEQKQEAEAVMPETAAAAADGAAAEEEVAAEAAAAEEEGAADVEDLTPLQQLLVLCGQETDLAKLPSMDDLLGQHVDLKKVRKIGEGTFGEAFKASGVVLKIVPMEGSILVNGEPQKQADEILAEVAITLTLSRLNGSAAPPGETPANVTSGFVETYGVGVCRGAYSEALCREWHRWDKENESENEPVDIFSGQPDQLFVVFVVADGGSDLEHFELRSFDEVRSILLQAALTVAVGEESCEFEHRDLHWGNLLIRRSEEPASCSAVRARLRGVDLEAATEGVTVTLIDFTLSRLVTVTGEVAFCDLAADPELFKGPKGNVQADTYRRMKKATKNSWQAHVPATNVFWMQYLVDICMTEKKGWGHRKEDLNALRAFKRRASSYTSCSELLFDDFLRPGLLIKD